MVDRRHELKLGEYDSAMIFRSKTRRGKVKSELCVPKSDPLPNSAYDLLACVLLLQGKSEQCKEARVLIRGEIEKQMK